MLDKKLEKALNRQINNEMSAAYNYLAMTAHFEHLNLGGFANWMRVQRNEELTHAQRLIKYVLDRGGKVELEAVPKPPTDFQSVQEVFSRALEMERENTASIDELYRLADELNDYATLSHLQWFLDEQVEEEKSFDEIGGLLELAGDNRSALLLLNEKLGQRAGGEAAQ